MIPLRSETMQIAVEVSPQVQNEAATRGLPIHAFIEQLLEAGMHALHEQQSISSAVDRIRALRRSEAAPATHL